MSTNSRQVPSPLYIGGFEHSAEVLDMSLDHFGAPRPARVYYPGSSEDASFVGRDGVEVLHADIELVDDAIEAFQSVGSRAVRANVHTFVPEHVLDAVLFINASGIDQEKVLDTVTLRRGGLVLSAAWGMRQPTALLESERLEFVAVTDAEADKPALVTEGLDDYLRPIHFDEFHTAAKRLFCERAYHQTAGWSDALDTPSVDEIMEAMDQGSGSVYDRFAHMLPLRKTAAFYIFQNLL